jgi:hypothetical protein
VEKTYEGAKVEEYFCPWCSEKWGMFDSKTGELIYGIDEKISSQKAYISNDGNHIVLINDWPLQPVSDSIVLVAFYEKGKLVKSYGLSDIFQCGYNVTTSISHFSWLMEDAKLNYTTNKLSLNTLELKYFEFNLKNGDLIKARKNKKLKNNDILVYGNVIKQGNNSESTFVIAFMAKFLNPGPLLFDQRISILLTTALIRYLYATVMKLLSRD